jgi:UDP-N-acetylglucosamine--N-acetylmuramyl-(pentapeptide) pyrophosphoryl-undecaprenol N-acetylglucosamine transferase
MHLVVHKHKGLNFKVIQQAKSEDIEHIKDIYKAYGIEFEISEFFHHIPEILSDAHFIIARSGASIISEFIQLECPAFFIPYPFASEKHQHFNADVIAKNGGGWWVDQDVVTPQIIANKIIEMYENRTILVKTAKNLSKLKIDSVNIIANVVEKIITSSRK